MRKLKSLLVYSPLSSAPWKIRKLSMLGRNLVPPFSE
jgi:hypothetical protein